MMLAMYESQVAAYYDPDTKTMTIVQRDTEFGPADRIFVAHEYDHALQDQYWDLKSIEVVDPSLGDKANAHLGLIEGDATVGHARLGAGQPDARRDGPGRQRGLVGRPGAAGEHAVAAPA